MAMTQAILLDFYGTVVHEDSAPIQCICNQVAAASPLGIGDEEVRAYWGQAFRQLLATSHGAAFRPQKDVEHVSLLQALRHFQADLDGGTLSEVLYRHWRQPELYPESLEVLADCPVPVCLVSNTDEAELQQALAYNGLHFEWIVTSEGSRAYKPRPEMFQCALDMLGLPASAVLHVGDSLGSDVRGARAMDIRVLWVNRRGRSIPAGMPNPDYVAPDLAGLLDLF
jgi:2-haloalkanoic acid dehalogenase type II